MQKFLKILLISLLVLVFVTAGAGGWFLLFFDADQYREEFTALVEKQTGRDFSIRGEIGLAPSLLPTLAVEKVSFGNPGWASTPAMISVDRLELRIALLPLLRGEIGIDRIYLYEPVIHLEIGPDGIGNWRLGDAGKVAAIDEQADGHELPRIDIRELEIEKAVVSYRDARRRSEPSVFRIERFHAAAQDIDRSLRLELAAAFEGIPIRLQGSAGSVAQMFAQSPYPLSLKLMLGSAKGEIEGQIGDPGRLTGIELRFGFRADSLSKLGRKTSGDRPDPGPVEVSGALEGDPSALGFPEFRARVADSRLAGSGSVSLESGRRHIRAELHSPRLNLSPYQPEKNNNNQKAERLFSTETLNVAGLQAADADIRLQVGRLHSREIDLSNLQANIVLRDGELDGRATAGLADGNLSARVRLHAVAVPSLEVRLEVRDMLPEKLPALAEDPIIRDGRTDILLEGRGSGASPAAIAGSWNGRMRVTVDQGRLLNKVTGLAGSDLIFSTFRMLNPLADREKDSELVCGVLNFVIEDGIARADKGIALQTARVNVLGSGVVDLKTEAIDFRAKPKAREGLGINLAQLGDAVYIGGTLTDPKPAADVKGALKTAGTVGAAVATGGLSLLAQGLFSRTFSTDDPCGVALGANEPDAVREQAPAAGESSPEQDPKQEKSTLDQTGDRLKNMFRGLFD